MKNQDKFKETEIGKIPEGWEEGKISNCIELIYGEGLPKTKRENGDIPVFGSNGIIDFHNKFLVKGPGIVIGRKGSVGEITFSKNDFWPIDTTYYVKAKENNDMIFWYYFLKTLKLNEMNSHSAVPGLNRNYVYEIFKSVPKITEQTAIAKILSDLDSKIELNQQMNKTLETIGQAIFKEYFVNFNFPNANGKPYKSSGGEMVDSELGQIPKGWKVGKISDIIYNQGGFAFKSEDFFDDGEIGIIKIKNVSGGIVDISNTQFVSEAVVENLDPKFKIESGSVLIAMTGAEVAKIGIVPKNNKELWLNQRVGMFKEKVDGGLLYSYIVLTSQRYQELLKNKAYGSAQPNISSSDIESISILLPSKESIADFKIIFQPIYDKMIENLYISEILSQIRDSLLPKLMSGEIRVKFSEEEIKCHT